MKKGDLLIGLIALIIMAFLGIGYKLYINNMGTDRYVNIYVDNKLIHSVKLTDDVDMEIAITKEDYGYGYNLIHIHNNGVEVEEADCPNKDDVRQGFVKMPGIPIICVPHHLKVIIEGGNSNHDVYT